MVVKLTCTKGPDKMPFLSLVRLRVVERELPQCRAGLPVRGLLRRTIDVPMIDNEPLDQPHRRRADAAAA